MTNIWKKGKITTNPYHETAFRALGMTRDVTLRAEIDQRVAERRQAVRNVPGYYMLGKRPLTEADLTNARQILFNPTRRILEELLEHHPEQPQVGEFERLLVRLPAPDLPQALPPPRHLAFLLRAVQEWAQDYLAHLPPVEIPAFPVDLEPIPPFGVVVSEHGGLPDQGGC